LERYRYVKFEILRRLATVSSYSHLCNRLVNFHVETTAYHDLLRRLVHGASARPQYATSDTRHPFTARQAPLYSCRNYGSLF